jgi:hypothetical protein
MPGFNFWSTFRTLRNSLPFTGTKEEKVNFARFDRSDTEFSGASETGFNAPNVNTIPNGNGKIIGEDGTPGYEGSEKQNGGFNTLEEDLGVRKNTEPKRRNVISAWQAGWNVTNAIQVGLISAPHALFSLITFMTINR